ncbi:MAG: tetratricopeptide repeat protein [Bacteroidales bacterium]|nr:tetratricopeptide repeat protein [Bacteroidales bacterium]
MIKGSHFKRVMLHVALMLGVVMLVISGSRALSQTREIDSLQYMLDRAKGEDRIDILLELSQAFLTISPERSIDYGKDALHEASGLERKKQQSQALITIGRGLYKQGQYEKALGYFQQAYTLGKEAGNKVMVARSNIHIGNVFAMLDQQEQALQYYKDAFKLNTNPQTNAQALSNIGNMFMKMNRPDSAHLYLKWAKEIRVKIRDDDGLAQSYNNLAVFYTRQGKPDKALSFYKDALKIRRQINDQSGIAEIYNNMALIYAEKEQYLKALDLLRKSQSIAREMGLGELLVTSNKLSSEIYARRNDYQQAYDYQKEYNQIQDSLLKQRTVGNINKLQSQYEVDTLRREKELLADKLSSYRTYEPAMYVLVFLLLAAIGYIILQYKNKLKNNKLLNEKNKKITEQNQRLEETLNIFYDSEKRRKAILKAIPDSMFVCNPAGQLLDFHSRSDDLNFLKSEVVLGRSMDDIFPDEFVKRAKAYMLKAQSVGEIYLFEFHQGKGDNISYYEARMGKSSEKEILFIIRDITERNKAKLELEKQIEFLQVLIDDIPVPIFYKNKDRIYLGCNKEFTRIIGKDKDQILGKTVYEVSYNEKAKEFDEKDKELLEKGGIQRYETSMKYADGGDREVIFYKTVFNDIDGSVGGLIGSIVDVTESKQYEKSLRESEQKMRELNATKDKFFSIIAHDLKTPFNAIMGFSNLLYDSYDSFDEEEKKEFIKNISEASDSTFKLLQNLLQWSRAQTGTIEMQPEIIDLSILVNENISVLKTHADNKNIKLQSHVDFGTTAYADANMITTVLRNFISNAIKFTYEKGHIEIFTEDSKNEVMVTVRDDGIGIDKDNVDKVFRIDKQFKKEGTASEQGTGLGLILCKEFIERNGGRIWVESEYEKGSDFKFSLPKSKSNPISNQQA